MANVNEGERWEIRRCPECGRVQDYGQCRYVHEHPDIESLDDFPFTDVVEVVPAKALREARERAEKAEGESRMLRAFIDRGEYEEDVAALLTVVKCSCCGALVGSDPTLCGPCGGESDTRRDEAIEEAREAREELERLWRDVVKAICKQEDLRSELRRALWSVAEAERLLTPGMKAGVAEAKGLLGRAISDYWPSASGSSLASEPKLDGSGR